MGTKMALVTGGSSGIGFAIACELAQRGYTLLLVSNQAAELDKCSRQITQQYAVPCFKYFADLAHPDAARQVYDHCRAENYEVEILVNNAGILLFSEVVEAPAERVRTILQLHMQTPTMLCRLFGEEMKQRGSGYILNVSSISSVMPYPGISLYGPTKTFLRYFTRALRAEMQAYGVSVACLLPGATATALYDTNKVDIGLAIRFRIMHTPDFVARKGIKALLNGRSECVPGWANKLAMIFLPLVPARLIIWLHKETSLLEKGREAMG
jgi:uncharacterized protein